MSESNLGRGNQYLALQLMLMELWKQGLEAIDDPGMIGQHLVKQLREMTDAEMAILFQCMSTADGKDHHVISFSPAHHKPLTEAGAIRRLIRLFHRDVEEVTLWRPGTSDEDIQEILAELACGPTIAMPLNAGSVRVGGVLLLDVPDSDRIAQVLQMLDTLSTVAALIFRNAFLFEEQQDIIQRSTRELQESKANYRELANSITDVFFAMDENLKYIYWNKASEELTGILSEEAIGKSLHELFPGIEGQKAAEMYREVLRTQQARRFLNEHQIQGKDYVFEINAYPTRRGLSVFVKDVTERVQAEAALRGSEQKFRALVKQAAEMLYLHDMAGHIVDVNRAAVAKSGYRRDELLRMKASDLDPDYVEREDQGEFWAALEAAGTLTFEARHRRKNGDIFPVEVKLGIVQLEEGQHVLALVRDITERMQAQEALQQSEERYRRLIESSDDMIFSVDRDGIFKTAGGKRLRNFGLTPQDVVGHSIEKLFGEETHQYIERHRQVVETGEAISYEHTFAFNNMIRTDLTTVYPVKNEEGTIEHVGVICRDITQRKRAQEELAEIFAMSLDMICIADINTAKFIKINPAFTDILGYAEDELLERPFLDFIHPDDVQATSAIIEEKLQAGEKVINFENRYRRKDGTYRWLNWVSHPVPRKGITYAIARDITERKQAEEALQQAHDALETRVAERTAELRQLVNAMAGREVRMAELKDVVRQLREQLQAAGLEPVADDPLLTNER